MKRIFRRNQVIITTLAIMIAAAEPSGHKTIQPGKTPCTSSTMPHKIMPASPTQPSVTRVHLGDLTKGIARASSEPNANSHSRARVSK